MNSIIVVRYQFNRQLLKKLSIHIPCAYHFHYWVYTQQKCMHICSERDGEQDLAADPKPRDSPAALVAGQPFPVALFSLAVSAGRRVVVPAHPAVAVRLPEALLGLSWRWSSL